MKDDDNRKVLMGRVLMVLDGEDTMEEDSREVLSFAAPLSYVTINDIQGEDMGK